MVAIPATFATWMSGCLMIVAACGDPLASKVTCYGSETCGPDELCKDQVFGAADDAGVSSDCKKVPDGCDIYDCSGSACSACIIQLCDAPANRPTVKGRYLNCQF
jgi:hypothetical protein